MLLGAINICCYCNELKIYLIFCFGDLIWKIMIEEEMRVEWLYIFGWCCGTHARDFDIVYENAGKTSNTEHYYCFMKLIIFVRFWMHLCRDILFINVCVSLM